MAKSKSKADDDNNENKENNPLAPVNEFNYIVLNVAPEEREQFAEVMRENLAGERITDRDLERVVLPAGGARQWEVPAIDGSEYQEAIEGIIIHRTFPRAYWQTSLDESGSKAPPDCSSPDGVKGVGTPGGDCHTCPFNQWGSAERGNGKACKEKQILFVLRTSDLLPMVVQVPSTSLQQVKNHFLRLASHNPPHKFYHTVTQLTLEKVEANPFDYSRIVLRSSAIVPDDQREAVEAYRNALMPSLQAIALQQDE